MVNGLALCLAFALILKPWLEYVFHTNVTYTPLPPVLLPLTFGLPPSLWSASFVHFTFGSIFLQSLDTTLQPMCCTHLLDCRQGSPAACTKTSNIKMARSDVGFGLFLVLAVLCLAHACERRDYSGKYAQVGNVLQRGGGDASLSFLRSLPPNSASFDGGAHCIRIERSFRKMPGRLAAWRCCKVYRAPQLWRFALVWCALFVISAPLMFCRALSLNCETRIIQ
jgi:hypothetical protein